MELQSRQHTTGKWMPLSVLASGCTLFLAAFCAGRGTGQALPGGVLAAGLLFSLLLAGYLRKVADESEESRRKLQERTRELQRQSEVGTRTEKLLQKTRDQLEMVVRDRTAELQASEESLREYAAMWETTFNAMGDAVAILDVTGRLHHCNAAMLKLLGKEWSQVAGTTCCHLVHDDPPPAAGDCPFKAAVASGRRETLVLEHRGLWLQVTVEPVFNHKGELAGAVHVITDITGLKKTERELVRVNRTLKTLSACNKALVFAEDERSLLVEICRCIVSHGGFPFSWVGYAQHDEQKSVLPMAWAGREEGYLDAVRVSWGDCDTGNGPCGMAIRSGSPHVSWDIASDHAFAVWREAALARGFLSSVAFPVPLGADCCAAISIYAGEPNGFNLDEIRLLQELAANLAYGISALRMRQEHEKLEEALRERADRYHTLVENIDTGIALVDEEQTLVAANSRLGEIFRRPVHEMIGRKCFAECGGSEACPNCPGTAALNGGKPASVERELLLADGARQILQVKAFPIVDAGGRATRFIKLVKDVTDQRKAEEEKALLELQLRHAQKLEAVGTMAGGIAHDFNNILTAINGYCSLIGSKIDQPEKIRSYLARLAHSSTRAVTLTNSLLAYSRKQPLSAQPTDLNQLVSNVAHILTRLLGEDIELTTVPAGLPAIVMGDTSQIEQVLMNLAANARDAMPRGGKLTIALSGVALDADFVRLHGFGRPGRYHLLTVSDTGCGMDQATCDRIFEPFFTTKEVGKGTGLGLSMAYGIVKQHDGYINVYSEPARGTTFRIYLPASCERPPAKQPPPSPAPAGGSETLLLVEDNEEIRNSLKELLEQEGYTVIEAVDGEDGIRQFKAHQQRVELVILDMVMPKMNGKAAYQAMKLMEPSIKAIFMSGYTNDILSIRGALQPEEEFVSKPVSITTLLFKIREVLHHG